MMTLPLPEHLSLFFELVKDFEEILKKKISVCQRESWCAETILIFFPKIWPDTVSFSGRINRKNFLKIMDNHILNMRNLSRKQIDELSSGKGAGQRGKKLQRSR